MNKFNRRRFLRHGVYATAGTFSLAHTSVAQAAWTRPTRRTQIRAAIIGSGFGGSVTALRLGEAGIPTVLVERGRAWEFNGDDSYPTLNNPGAGMLWREPTKWVPGLTGMMQEYLAGNYLIGMGACLGGGSMVYGGVLLQPKRELFEQAMPFISYDDMDNIYYPRVLAKVSGGPIPDDILNTPNYTAMRVFIDNATQAGLDVVRSEVGFNWDIIREEIAGKRIAAASIGEYVFGCNSGAKNTLDRNYLVDAAATGNVQIEALHNVTHIRRNDANNCFETHCEVLNQRGKIIGYHIIESEYLMMAAGSTHTTRLLLKAKALGDIPTLNDAIGEQWGTNGDQLMARTGIDRSTGPVQAGPPAIAAFDLDNPYKATAFMHSPNPLGGEFTQLQMGMSISDKMSTATYRRWSDTLSVHWSRRQNSVSDNAIKHTMEKMSEYSGGRVADYSVAGTWHPLGGAAMGAACSDAGEVLGTPNLFVVDGALLPGSAGVANPALTIGANAERVMEKLVPKLV